MSRSISIKLLNHQSVWKPGDTILGQVCFACDVRVDIKDVSVSFEGRIKGCWEENDGFKVRLFYIQKQLCRDPFTLPPGNKLWPFELVIPMKCRWPYENYPANNTTFDNAVEQQLPPTFFSGENHNRIDIGYNLKASIHFSNSFFDKNFTMPIIIIPPRIYRPAQFSSGKRSHPFTIQTLHLDLDVESRFLTFKEKMRTAFRLGKLPHHNFKVSLELPESIWPNSSINIIVYLQHDLQDSTVTELPVVTMSKFSLALESDVLVRTPRHSNGPNYQWKDSQHICDLWKEITLPKRLELSNMPLQRFGVSPTLELQPNTIPTFSTPYVAIRYCWKAKLTLVCAGKILNGETSSPCMVLGLPSNQITASQIAVSSGEQLPAYIR